MKEQVKSGLRLGGGLAVFLVAMAPLVDGLRRVVWAAPSHQLLWSPIGMAELIVAAGLLVSYSTGVHYFGRCMLFGTIKGVFALVAGGPTPRLELAWAVIIFSVTLVLIVGVILRGTPLLDRIALTPVCVLPWVECRQGPVYAVPVPRSWLGCFAGFVVRLLLEAGRHWESLAATGPRFAWGVGIDTSSGLERTPAF